MQVYELMYSDWLLAGQSDDQGLNSGKGWEFFGSGAHPASYLIGTRGSFPGVK